MFVLCMLRECVQEFNIVVQVCMDCVVQLLKSCLNLDNSHHQQNNVSAHGICILMHAYKLYHCYMFLVLTSMCVQKLVAKQCRKFTDASWDVIACALY